jgi:hypothetical protein
MLTETIILTDCLGMISSAFQGPIHNTTEDCKFLGGKAYILDNHKVEVENVIIENEVFTWFKFYKKRRFFFGYKGITTELCNQLTTKQIRNKVNDYFNTVK